MNKLFTELKGNNAPISKSETCEQIKWNGRKPQSAGQARQNRQTDNGDAKFNKNQGNIMHPSIVHKKNPIAWDGMRPNELILEIESHIPRRLIPSKAAV